MPKQKSSARWVMKEHGIGEQDSQTAIGAYSLVAEQSVKGHKAIITRVFRNPPGESITVIQIKRLLSDVEAASST